MLVKDSGKSKFELPKKTTTTTSHGGSGLRRNPSLLELQSSKRIAPTASDFLEMHNPKSSTYVGSTLLSPLKEKIHTTTKPSGTRPDSNVSGMPSASGNNSNKSSGTGSSASYSQSANLSGNASNVYGDLMSMYEQQQRSLAEQLQAQQAYYEQQLRAQQEARQQAAQNAYNSNMSALENAYAKRLAGLDSNLASTKDLLASSYGNSRDALNASAEKSLQEAYINRMMNEKSLRQQLNAQGLNGGASESAIASMLNNYGTSRNNINTATADSLRSLEETYNSNIANAQQKYNDAVGDAADTNLAYKMQLENDLANGVASSYSDLYSALANMDSNYTNSMTNLINNQSAASADLQQALYDTMLKNSLGLTSANVSGGSNQTLTSQVKRRYQNGETPEDLIDSLLSEGKNADQIAQIFALAGIAY